MYVKPPLVSPELVKWLEWLYPDRFPDASLPDREVWFQGGQVSVVRKLKHELEKQTKQALTGDSPSPIQGG